jgi:hypothetical protein
MKEKEIVKFHKLIVTGLEKDKVISSDMVNSLADYILGQRLIKDFNGKMTLNQEGLEDEKMNYIKAYINNPIDMSTLWTISKSTAIEKTLETLNRMAKEGHLKEGVDYDSTKRIDDEFCLKLNYAAFYHRFIKYCQDNNIDYVSLKDFKKELKEKDYCLYHNRPVAFRTGGYLNHFKTFRAAVLSIEKLEEQNLNVEYLISGQK